MKIKLLTVFLIFQICVSSLISVSTFASEYPSSNNGRENFVITNLSDEELKKCEMSGTYKKNWGQRLKWFESKIINKYKSFNAKNVLVVGEQKFLDAFKQAAEKQNWHANFTYTTSANTIKSNAKMANGKENILVIDSLYKTNTLKSIYKNLKVSSFSDIYKSILYDETLSYLKKNNVKYYFFNSPILSKTKNPDEYEKILISAPESIDKKDRLNKVYSNTPEDYNFYLKCNNPKIIYNGKYNIFADEYSDDCKVIDNKVVTEDQPKNFKNHIYMYGACTAANTKAIPKSRISSILQRLINKDFSNKYIVENCAVNGGSDLCNDFERILDTPFQPGDIVIDMLSESNWHFKRVKRYGFVCDDLSPLFDRPHNLGYWCIDDNTHGLSTIARNVIANHIYDVIKTELNNAEPVEPLQAVKYRFENEIDNFVDDQPEFKKFLVNLKNVAAKNNVKGTVGSLNMNANPFTLGHRYLVEQALKEVDHLYLFVVEEDKSDFSFKDRYEMIKRGVADLKNVTVLTTGQWMCSSLTFPDYFDKENLQDKKLDPTMDIDLYGKYIAPAIGATKRFTGEEPFDLITRQHNNFMKQKLPFYKIQFYEFPRKTLENGEAISATKVRKALKEKDFETLRKYVPQTTFDYLKENYERIIESINERHS